MSIHVDRERRVARRHRVRYRLRFWNDDFGEGGGLTSDVSATGMYVETRKLPTTGARLHLEVDVDGTAFFCEGTVARVQKVSAAVAPVLSPGFGIRLLTWPEICGLAEHQAEQELFLDLRQRLRPFVEDELSSGGLFIDTATPPAMGTEVPVTMMLPEPHGELHLSTRVVYLSEDPPGAGLEVGDAPTLARQLMAIAAPEVAVARLEAEVGDTVEVRLDRESGSVVATCRVDALVQPASGVDLTAEAEVVEPEIEADLTGLIVGMSPPPPVDDEGQEVDAAFHALSTGGDSPAVSLATLPLDVSTLDDLRRMFEVDLVKGGLFVPGATGVQANEDVRVAITLPTPHGVFEVDASVVQVLEAPLGVGVHIDNSRMLMIKCAQILESFESEDAG